MDKLAIVTNIWNNLDYRRFIFYYFYDKFII